MAIRKVSDLERLNLQEEFDAGNQNQISNMFFEVSWPDSYNSKSFISKKLAYEDILYNVLVQNLVCSETLVDFWSPITFHSNVTMLCGLQLSGDFFLNKDFPGDELLKYQTLMRNGKQTLYSYTNDRSGSNGSGTTTLCSEYANVLCAYVRNDIHAKGTNALLAKQNIICSDTQLLVSFADDKIEFKPTTTTIFEGDTYFTKVINGCALCAKWADLAEMYSTDSQYTPGTLIQFGGEKEVVVATTEANGVVTTEPGLILNSKSEGENVGIALVGRTSVRVAGKVKKFDKLKLSNIPGVAEVKHESDASKTIGIALEAKMAEDEGLVEAVVQLAL